MHNYEEMKNAYTEVCLMFSESSSSEPAEFFTFFKTFIKAWKVCKINIDIDTDIHTYIHTYIHVHV